MVLFALKRLFCFASLSIKTINKHDMYKSPKRTTALTPPATVSMTVLWLPAAMPCWCFNIPCLCDGDSRSVFLLIRSNICSRGFPSNTVWKKNPFQTSFPSSRLIAPFHIKHICALWVTMPTAIQRLTFVLLPLLFLPVCVFEHVFSASPYPFLSLH